MKAHSLTADSRGPSDVTAPTRFQLLARELELRGAFLPAGEEAQHEAVDEGRSIHFGPDQARNQRTSRKQRRP